MIVPACSGRCFPIRGSAIGRIYPQRAIIVAMAVAVGRHVDPALK